MSNINAWIKNELYPSLYEYIDRAFPEHNFKHFSGGWRSKTYLNGSPHKDRLDKTVVTKKAPGYIMQQGGQVMSLVDYVMVRDAVDFIRAVNLLAKEAHLSVPQLLDIDIASYQKYETLAKVLEECNNYFNYCLEMSPAAGKVKEYLFKRGYSVEDINAMELRYIPSQEKLFKFLVNKGFQEELIIEALKIGSDDRIGSTHKLTIPYRSGGKIKGFKFRTIGDSTPRYLNNVGLDKIGGFFNLVGIKGAKDLVIVEGELDSLLATVKGVDNVVATGGSSINPDQIKDAIRRGAKRFTICLDMEPGKDEDTARKINSAIQVILGEGVNRVYIITLPDLGGGKTDPDRLIKEKGIESFKNAISSALPYYQYKLLIIMHKYGKIQQNNGFLEPKQVDDLLDEVVETTINIPDAIDKDRYKKMFTSNEYIRELGITEESLTITLDKLTSSNNKVAQAQELKILLAEDVANKGGEYKKATSQQAGQP